MVGDTDTRTRELLALGDADGAATLTIRAVGPPVLRYLRSIVRDEDDAKDAFSQWAEHVWRGLPAFRGEASLQTWCLRLAYHAALALTHEAWRRHGRRLETGEASRIAETVRTSTAVRVERQRTILARLREELSLHDRTLLDLRVDHQLSWAEIAEVLAGDGARPEPATVAKRFERLKARLGDQLRREGLVD